MYAIRSYYAVAAISKYVAQDGKWVLWEDSEYASGKRSLVKPH